MLGFSLPLFIILAAECVWCALLLAPAPLNTPALQLARWSHDAPRGATITHTVASVLSVLLATFFTFAIFGALTAYAHTTKTEWNFGGMATLALLWSLLLLAGASAFFPVSSAAMALLGALLFCGYIVVDTQALLTRLGPDDYVFAALSLFLDLVNLFLRLLQLLGQRER